MTVRLPASLFGSFSYFSYFSGDSNSSTQFFGTRTNPASRSTSAVRMAQAPRALDVELDAVQVATGIEYLVLSDATCVFASVGSEMRFGYTPAQEMLLVAAS